MAIYSFKTPDGKIHDLEAPEGTDPRKVMAVLEQRLSSESAFRPRPVARKLGGFWDSVIESAKTFGLGDEAAAFAANPTEENRKAFIAAGDSKFRKVGFGEGENWAAFKQLREQGWISAEDQVIVYNTGAAHKYIDSLERLQAAT